MRTEQEMFDTILNIAKENERIRAVYMNGSRTNPKLQKDNFQDYDIVYVVTELKWFLKNPDWISAFGELAMVQEPDKNDMANGAVLDISRSYGWLMLFKDGNRIDLHLETVCEDYGQDKLTVTLLDKDNMLPQISAPSDVDYFVSKPTETQYFSVCNNFWWCLQNVAKGIARDQLTYAMNMYMQVVHEKLESMINWYIGAQTAYSVSVGMWGKYYKQYLPSDLYQRYSKTYSDADYDNLWNAIFAACDLFGTVAPIVADRLGYAYHKQDEEAMMDYLRKAKSES